MTTLSSHSLLTNVTLDDYATNFNWGFHSSNWTAPATTGDRDYPNGDSYLEQFVAATYHETTIVNASATLTFTGSSVYVYGISGPTQGYYTASLLASRVTTLSPVTRSAHNPSSNSTNFLLFSATGLDPSNPHQVELVNLGNMGNESYGDALLVDYALATVSVGATGASLTNTTIEDSDRTKLVYSGQWDSNNDTRFSGGTSTYTNQPTASVALNFTGSAIYVFGDTVDDHGEYTVTLDGQNQVLDDYTRVLKFDTLKYYAAGLDSGSHELVITNTPTQGAGDTYFDFDSIVITTPSEYASANSSTNATATTTSSSTSTKTSSPARTSTMSTSATSSPTSAVSLAETRSIRKSSLLVIGLFLFALYS